GGLAGFSNYGATAADLAAPGVDIATTTLPPAITLYAENFENFNAAKWTISPSGSWQVQTDSMEGTKAFKWMSGINTTATLLDTLDMRERRGGLLTFRLHHTPQASQSFTDYLLMEYQAKGSSTWLYFAAVASTVTGQTVGFHLGPVDDTLY